MATLRVFLVYHMNRDRMNFGEGDGYYVGQQIKSFLDDVCAGSKVFTDSDYFSDATADAVGRRDLVCYILERRRDSIVSARTGTTPSKNGATAWSTNDHAMISEVYMDTFGDYDDRYDQMAVCIMHELMHNKLDAHPSRSVFSDIHTDIRGGVLCKETINASASPSAADVKAMRRGIGLEIAQYTGRFPTT